MSFGSRVPSTPILTPMYNLGYMLDIPTGEYHEGEYGNYVLNGGWGDIMSITGIGHSYKSTENTCFELRVLDRYLCAEAHKYDSENVMSPSRANELGIRMANISKIDFTDPDDPNIGRYTISSMGTVTADGKVFYGDLFQEQVQNYALEVFKDKKAKLYTTPFFIGKHQVKVKKPLFLSYDSLSMLKFSKIEEGVVEDHKLGDSEQNTIAMTEGRLKTQLNNSMPALCRMAEIRICMTAHTQKVGGIVGKFDAPKQRLIYGKRDYEIKGVGTSFIKINGLIIDIQSCDKFNNKEAKTGVMYPLVESDRSEHCTDLNLLTIVIARNKTGSSGMTISHIVSQREGILEHLGMFKTLRDHGPGIGFGMTGDKTKQSHVMVPDITLTRTTVREKINNSYTLRRAFEVTSELLQQRYIFSPESNIYWCTPEELYKDIKEQGYNWETLLGKSRYYWVFKEEEHMNLPQLTTMDLLRMRAGLYTPYWLKSDFIEKAKGKLREVLDTIPKTELRG